MGFVERGISAAVPQREAAGPIDSALIDLEQQVTNLKAQLANLSVMLQPYSRSRAEPAKEAGAPQLQAVSSPTRDRLQALSFALVELRGRVEAMGEALE